MEHGETHHHHDASQEEPAAPSSRNSERYELEDLFPGEAPENLHFFKVAGLVTLAVLLLLALAVPFIIIFS